MFFQEKLCMNTNAISNTSSTQQTPYWQQRWADMQQLAHALNTGDLNGAQAAYNAIVQIGKTDPYGTGVPFKMANREQDFQAVGAALQSGDLAGAKQALKALYQTFQQPEPSPVPPANSSVGPATVVNLSGGQ
jgi:hypothetical protein